MPDDLFEAPLPNPHPQPKVGRDHPETSHQAAEKVKPFLPSIRTRILEAFLDAQAHGLTDDELAERLPDILINSLRPSRVGLHDECWLLDSGQRRRNAQGNECIVWLHRDYFASPPAIREMDKGGESASRQAFRREAAELAVKLQPEIRQMQSEGRSLFVPMLERAAFLLAALSQPGS